MTIDQLTNIDFHRLSISSITNSIDHLTAIVFYLTSI